MRRFLADLPLCLLALVACLSSADAKPRRTLSPAPMADCFTSGPEIRCGHWYQEGAGLGERAAVSSHRKTKHARKGQPRSRVAVQSGGGFDPLVAEARRWLGATAAEMGVRRNLWCAAGLNKWLHNIGRRGTGSDLARSFASYGYRVSGPQIGAIAVMTRGKRGGHVGVVSGIDASGNPIVISANHNRRVAEAVYPRGRVYAYVMP